MAASAEESGCGIGEHRVLLIFLSVRSDQTELRAKERGNRMRPRRGLALIALCWAIGGGALCAATPEAKAQEGVKSEIELTTKDIGAKENAIGNLIADSLRSEAKTDIAIIAASYFAEDAKIAKGAVSLKDLLKTLEYKDDSVTVLKLTGSQILKGLEHGLYLFPKANSGFLHFSGMTVTIDAAAEKEKRVLSVKIDGNAIEKSQTYKVAMPTPLANGALGYFNIWKKDDIDKEETKRLDEKTLETALKSYLKEHKTISKPDERLVVKGKIADAK